MSAPAVRFDVDYYLRFYEDPTTRIYTQARHAKLVAGVVNLAEWFMTEVDSVLDVGAGVGWWGKWLAKHRPGVRYVSTELDPAVCAKYGHRQADVTQLPFEEKFDLVVCQGVLPYLEDGAVQPAFENLARVCNGLLFLEAITSEDLDGSVDLTLTDTRVRRRPEQDYRSALEPHFRQVGAGLFAVRSAALVFYRLEANP